VPNTDLTRDATRRASRCSLSLGRWGWEKAIRVDRCQARAEDLYVASVFEGRRRGDYDGIDLDGSIPTPASPSDRTASHGVPQQLDELRQTKGLPDAW